MGRYLIKKSQIVAIMVFLIEILGALALAQTNTTESVLERIGWGVLILSSLKYEFQKAHCVLQYCYFSEREVAML